MYAVGVTTTHPAAALEEAGADEVVADLVGYDVPRPLRDVEARAAASAARETSWEAVKGSPGTGSPAEGRSGALGGGAGSPRGGGASNRLGGRQPPRNMTTPPPSGGGDGLARSTPGLSFSGWTNRNAAGAVARVEPARPPPIKRHGSRSGSRAVVTRLRPVETV